MLSLDDFAELKIQGFWVTFLQSGPTMTFCVRFHIKKHPRKMLRIEIGSRIR